MVSPAGVGVDANWARVLAGEPTAGRDRRLRDCPIDFACRVPGFDAATLLEDGVGEAADPYTQFALFAAEEAAAGASLDWTTADPTRAGVVLGTVSGGASTLEAQHARLLRSGPGTVSPRTMPMGLPNMAAGELSIRFGLRGISLGIAAACASGAVALGIGRDLIRSGMLDIVLAGGADAAVTPLSMAALPSIAGIVATQRGPQRRVAPFLGQPGRLRDRRGRGDSRLGERWSRAGSRSIPAGDLGRIRLLGGRPSRHPA